MKILFLNVTGALGGAERLLLDLLASLAAADASLSLHLALGEDGPLAEEARRLGVTVTVLPLPAGLLAVGDSALEGRWRQAARLVGQGFLAGWHAWRYSARLRRLIAALGPDVVHSNSLKFHLLGAMAVPRGTPLVWHLHDFIGSRRVMRRCLRWAARRAAGAVAVSHAVAADARPHLGGLPIEVVANAIDTERFAPGPGDGAWLDDLAGLPPAPAGTVRVGLVATYARWKGQDVFLDAARLAAESARFYVVGGPIYQTRGSQWSRDELEARAAGLTVGFVPFQADTAPVYRGLDLVVHASTRPEPFGLTIAESMACGRPVVVSGGGGAAELFTHGRDAVGVPAGDAAALADALRGLIADSAARRRLADAARATAACRFGRGRLGPQVLAAYHLFRPETRS